MKNNFFIIGMILLISITLFQPKVRAEVTIDNEGQLFYYLERIVDDFDEVLEKLDKIQERIDDIEKGNK